MATTLTPWLSYRGGNLEEVADPVAHHCPAVAVWRVPGLLQADRARAQCALIRGVGIVDVDVEKGWKCFTLIGL